MGGRSAVRVSSGQRIIVVSYLWAIVWPKNDVRGEAKHVYVWRARWAGGVGGGIYPSGFESSPGPNEGSAPRGLLCLCWGAPLVPQVPAQVPASLRRFLGYLQPAVPAHERRYQRRYAVQHRRYPGNLGTCSLRNNLGAPLDGRWWPPGGRPADPRKRTVRC
jgi:hypothetical protein